MKSALWGAKRLATADLRVDDSGIWLGTDRYYEGSNDLWPVELRESRMRKGIPPTVRVYYVVEESNYRYYVFLAQKPCRAFHYSPGELSG